MENTTSTEANDHPEQARSDPMRPNLSRGDRVHRAVDAGIRDLGAAGADVALALGTLGDEVARELQRAGVAAVDASEVVARDVVNAGRKLERTIDDAVDAPSTPLEAESEPVVAATLAQIP
jgi:hypothetical protein